MTTHRPRVSGVYFVRGKATRLVKIGFSTDVGARIDALRAQSPDDLELLGVLQGTLQTERALHARFWELTHHGEWFRESPELIQLAQGGADAALHIKSGSHDPRHVRARRRWRASPAPHAFAARVRQWRLECGLSAHDVCRLVGEAMQHTVYGWEDGTSRPSPESAIKLAAAWGISIEEFRAIPGASRKLRSFIDLAPVVTEVG